MVTLLIVFVVFCLVIIPIQGAHDSAKNSTSGGVDSVRIGMGLSQCELSLHALQKGVDENRTVDLKLNITKCGNSERFAEDWKFASIKMSKWSRSEYLMYPTYEVFSSVISMNDISTSAERSESGSYELVISPDSADWVATVSSTFREASFAEIEAGEYFLSVTFEGHKMEGKGRNLVSNEVLVTLD